MSKVVWNPVQTRDAQKLDGYGVVIQRRSVSFWIENKWREIPVNYWAWTFVVREQTEGFQSFNRLSQPERKGLGFWVPKLLPSGNGSRSWDQISRELLPSRRTPSLANRRGFRGTDIPPELFKHVCEYADRSSGRLRLVNQYWDQQCRPHVFKQISFEKSPQRLGPFLALTRDASCRFMPLVQSLAIPNYSAETKSPFFHLVGQTGIPVDGWAVLQGPFGKGHRTIRSIHFAIPQSLPQSFSRGIRIMVLVKVHFQRFEDLTSLTSGLPDLEVLQCFTVTFGSFPAELPHRQPRNNRNKLTKFSENDCKCIALNWTDRREAHILGVLGLFSSVYNSASFFNEVEVAVILALAQLIPTAGDEELCTTIDYIPGSKSRLFKIKNDGFFGSKPSFAFRTRLVSSDNNNISSSATTIYLDAIDCDTVTVNWTKFVTACEHLSPPPEFVIGGGSIEIDGFAADVAEKTPSLFRPGAVHYCVEHLDEDRRTRYYRTSLDSGKLEGEGKESYLDLYP